MSSVRAVKCLVKSYNERNPYCLLPSGKAGDSYKTAGANREEGGDNVKSSWPLYLGLHTCYNGWDKGQPLGDQELISKPSLSSDWSLQFDSMKLESLVIAHQQWRGEYVLGTCTHRPSSQRSQLDLKSAAL